MKGTELHPGDKLKLPAKGKSTVKSRKSGTAKRKKKIKRTSKWQGIRYGGSLPII